MHAAFGAPTQATFLSAIRKSFIIIPGLSATEVARYWPNLIATAQGHMDRIQQGLHSTKSTVPTSYDIEVDNDDTFPIINQPSSNQILVKSITLTHRQHVDLTGRFSIIAASGNAYMLIMYRGFKLYTYRIIKR